MLCAPVVEREASEQGIALDAHYAHLMVHGALHAQGFDHESDADAARMEARESEILAGLGFANPYAPASAPAPLAGSAAGEDHPLQHPEVEGHAPPLAAAHSSPPAVRPKASAPRCLRRVVKSSSGTSANGSCRLSTPG